MGQNQNRELIELACTLRDRCAQRELAFVAQLVDMAVLELERATHASRETDPRV